MNRESNHFASILAIEDDPVLGAHVHEQLGRHGFQVTWCRTGLQGLETARNQVFDLVLMDILLPEMNGLDVLEHLRQDNATPVILMSALGAEHDRISGFRRGADDYLPKPFSVDELHVRVEAILRRVALEQLRRLPRPAADDLEFDPEAGDVHFGAKVAGLTRSEFRLLDLLNRHPDEMLTKAFLYQQVLQRGFVQHDRSLDMHVSQIRRKLKAIGYTTRQLRTVWGKGYVLSAGDPNEA